MSMTIWVIIISRHWITHNYANCLVFLTRIHTQTLTHTGTHRRRHVSRSVWVSSCCFVFCHMNTVAIETVCQQCCTNGDLDESKIGIPHYCFAFHVNCLHVNHLLCPPMSESMPLVLGIWCHFTFHGIGHHKIIGPLMIPLHLKTFFVIKTFVELYKIRLCIASM